MKAKTKFMYAVKYYGRNHKFYQAFVIDDKGWEIPMFEFEYYWDSWRRKNFYMINVGEGVTPQSRISTLAEIKEIAINEYNLVEQNKWRGR
tara:strand:+ start:39 stop:311 length:273 start_codon:yes stop_codon:yes gene_type:complete